MGTVCVVVVIMIIIIINRYLANLAEECSKTVKGIQKMHLKLKSYCGPDLDNGKLENNPDVGERVRMEATQLNTAMKAISLMFGKISGTVF